MGDYVDLHRLFLQSLMSQAILTKSCALKRLKRILERLGHENVRFNDGDLSNFLNEIREKINAFGFDIREIRSEMDGEVFVVLINLNDDSSVFEKINHPYTVKERELFRLLLEAVVMNNVKYGTLPTTVALNIPNSNMRPGEVQDVIDKLVADHWFTETSLGNLVPAPRCIAEFDLYFKKNFHDHVQVCMLCSNVVFDGIHCDCGIISHRHCLKQFNKNRKDDEWKCPSCKEAVVIEENEENQTEPLPGPSRKRGRSSGVSPNTPTNTPGPSRNGQRRGQVEDGEMPGPSGLQEETPGPSSRPRRKRTVHDEFAALLE